MYLDLWSPGVTEDSLGLKLYLLNSMCDLTQFTISSVTNCILAETLAQLFMVDVLLTFGMCSVVVIDDGSPFKGIFVTMCTKLKPNYWCLAQGNHRGNSVEKYHRYLDKTQSTTGNDQ